MATAAPATYADHLIAAGFTLETVQSPYGYDVPWYRKGQIRVVIDDDTPTVYHLDSCWSVTLPRAPVDVLAAVLGTTQSL